jgi:hypothetical protein
MNNIQDDPIYEIDAREELDKLIHSLEVTKKEYYFESEAYIDKGDLNDYNLYLGMVRGLDQAIRKIKYTLQYRITK